MIRYELYLDSDNNLVICIVNNGRKILKGPQTYEVVNKIFNNSIMYIPKEPNSRDVILKYENYEVVIYNAEKVVQLRGMDLIVKNIEKYIEKESFKKTKKIKVK